MSYALDILTHENIDKLSLNILHSIFEQVSKKSFYGYILQD
ncbi:hypothetical protein DsansV1_C36g0232171 [Dioscorea sansibarensis]